MLGGLQGTLWIYELPGGPFNRLTFEGINSWPVWTPDGKRVTYASTRAEPWRLFWKPFDGTGKEEALQATGNTEQVPYSWSPDGKTLVYSDVGSATAQDIWILPMDGDRRPRPLLQTSAAEVDARVSPDNRWLAYASNESGRFEVYVQPFMGSGGKWQISTDGGREPVWAHSGRELFYRSADRMMATEVTSQPAFQPATSRVLFQGPYETTTTNSPNFDITPDDQRFLMVQPSAQRSLTSDFNVVLNWLEELKRLVPTK
jgi:Tol biopolymer transport system component